MADYRRIGPVFTMKLPVQSGTEAVPSDVLTVNSDVRRTESRVVAIDTYIGLNKTKVVFTNRKISPLHTDVLPV